MRERREAAYFGSPLAARRDSHAWGGDDDDELCIYIPLQANYNVLRRGGRQPAVRRTGAPVGSRCVRGSVVSL